MTDTVCCQFGCDRPASEPVAIPLRYTPSVYVGLYCVEHSLAVLNAERTASRVILAPNLGAKP